MAHACFSSTFKFFSILLSLSLWSVLLSSLVMLGKHVHIKALLLERGLKRKTMEGYWVGINGGDFLEELPQALLVSIT